MLTSFEVLSVLLNAADKGIVVVTFRKDTFTIDIKGMLSECYNGNIRIDSQFEKDGLTFFSKNGCWSTQSARTIRFRMTQTLDKKRFAEMTHRSIEMIGSAQ